MVFSLGWPFWTNQLGKLLKWDLCRDATQRNDRQHRKQNLLTLCHIKLNLVNKHSNCRANICELLSLIFCSVSLIPNGCSMNVNFDQTASCVLILNNALRRAINLHVGGWRPRGIVAKVLDSDNIMSLRISRVLTFILRLILLRKVIAPFWVW